jgi:hypothetical protein
LRFAVRVFLFLLEKSEAFDRKEPENFRDVRKENQLRKVPPRLFPPLTYAILGVIFCYIFPVRRKCDGL